MPEPSKLTQAFIDRVTGVIAKTQQIDPTTVTIDKSFEELNIDSLDGVNILFALESEFDLDIPDEDAKTITTVRGMCEGIHKLVIAKESGANAPNPKAVGGE